MAAGSLLTLFDDIATILDDVAILTKKAAAKTTGLLGDDLALNAEQVSGVVAKREVAVVWAVAKGSFLNKLILVPVALLISAFAPWAITPILMLGGLYLCFEGVEKVHHALQHRGKRTEQDAEKNLKELAENPDPKKVETEAAKIKGAVRTDLILSAEIIAIALDAVADADLTRQVIVLSVIAIGVTVGVYGLVAGIVKLDDLGLYLTRQSKAFFQKLGSGILWAAPLFMKTLSIVGTAAMFLVGGGILTHGIPWLHHQIVHLAESIKAMGGMGGAFSAIAPTLLDGITGLIAGVVVLGIVMGFRKLRGKPAH
ncbi:DUF808 domain-containing protein [Luteolibacter sp. AS25]|uniref:DUF808 domain-containing protein n=1 Tax=Luteolibacter sp. AS25 TaxID=3135776 RepID=UPI00398B41B0